MAFIALKDIEKLYHSCEIDTIALRNVNLEIGRGEFVSVMGPSGCGKSTLLNLIGLLDLPTRGEIEIGGKPTSRLGDTARARFRNSLIGFVFQYHHLIPTLTVGENVALPIVYSRRDIDRRRRVAELLDRLGLAHRADHFPTQLSGGQCQRVAIARAIAADPEIILADEPTGNLDSKTGEDVMNLLHELNRRDGRTIVMVTHNEHQARDTDRIIRFFDGRRVE